MVFSTGQIIVTATTGAILSFLVVFVYGRRTKETSLSIGEALIQALVVGVSIVLWRLAGNTTSLNEDPIAFVSPNDVLCPVLTYVCLGVYAGLRGNSRHAPWARTRGALTLISLIVNIVTI